MDYFRWSKGNLDLQAEESVYSQNAVTIYNLEQKTGFSSGRLQLTSHRLFWHAPVDPNCRVEASLSRVANIEVKQVNKASDNRINRSYLPKRIVISFEPGYQSFDHLSIIDPGLIRSSSNPFVQFEFEYGGHNEFFDQLNQQLERKKWLSTNAKQAPASSMGITGIQRDIQTRLDQQDRKINNSFKDLSVLMNQAKEMVTLSNSITAKLAKQASSSVNEDEELLKGYFSNMGIIDSPVTKEGSGSKYFKDLAVEISRNLTEVIAEFGGIMTLSDVFCRLNRARAIAGLISAEDLLNACKQLNKLDQRLKYNVYADLNLHVLEIVSMHSEKVDEILDLVKADEYLSAYGLSKTLNCSLIVAKKHLLDGERIGRLCRDETDVGIKFYRNLFLLK